MLHINYLKKVHTEKISWRNCMINTYLLTTKSQHFTTMILWLHFLNLLNHFKIYWTHILSLNIYIKIIFSNIMTTSLSHPRKLMISTYYLISDYICISIILPQNVLQLSSLFSKPRSSLSCWCSASRFCGNMLWTKLDWLALCKGSGVGKSPVKGWKFALVRKGSGPGGFALDWGLTKSKGNSVIFLIFF